MGAGRVTSDCRAQDETSLWTIRELTGLWSKGRCSGCNGICRRQAHLNNQATLRGVSRDDFSTVQVNGAFGDGKPNAEPTRGPAAGTIQPIKRMEDRLESCLGYAGTVVLYLQHHLVCLSVVLI